MTHLLNTGSTPIADTVRRRVVARSGYSNYSLGLDGRYQWTLEWAGGMWNYVPSFGGPSPVNGYAAAFDVQRQRTVMGVDPALSRAG